VTRVRAILALSVALAVAPASFAQTSAPPPAGDHDAAARERQEEQAIGRQGGFETEEEADREAADDDAADAAAALEAAPPPPKPAKAAPASPYDVTVRERRPTTAASSSTVRARDFELQPIDSPGEILRIVPGLVTAQHAGGGKADQILFRGFDADHGTDLAIFLDDSLPVNMRSHAHGQGYADLHFVIPETIDRLEVFKGPYFAEFGDFDTAGAVNLVPREYVPESYAKVELGEFNTKRYVFMASPRFAGFGDLEAPATALVAGEIEGSDGPFDDPQNMSRYLLNARASARLGEAQRLTFSGDFYDARWNASGQIPQRAVRDGQISRFGSIDNTEGGNTARFDALVRHSWKPSSEQTWQTTLWASKYALDLFSDFTYFLDDPRGDGIEQKDTRWLYGLDSVYRQSFEAVLPQSVSAGLETRTDDAHVRLRQQFRRDVFAVTTDSDVAESSLALWLQDEVFLTDWARAVVGLRGETFWFRVDSKIAGPGQPEGNVTDSVLLPKANLILSPFSDAGPFPLEPEPMRALELYLNFGEGYHSNDAREVACNPAVPPDPDEPCEHTKPLPLALGWEVGLRTRAFDSRLDLALSYFWLNLQQELVWVGDAGTTEPRPRSRRQGIELETRAQLLDWLSYSLDVVYSSAEFANGEHVPQSPRFVASTGFTVRHPIGILFDIRMRTLGRRYALEDSQRKLHGYAVADASLRYRWRKLEAFVALQNITNEKWRSAEFFYTSRQAFEPPGGIDDYHFTPGNPRNVRGGVTVYF
jgi:outer membrane receptor protein involved in Fe transport